MFIFYKDFVILPRMDYALPMWGTALSQYSIRCLQYLWLFGLPCHFASMITCHSISLLLVGYLLPTKWNIVHFTLCTTNIFILIAFHWTLLYCLDHKIYTKFAVHLTLPTYEGVHYLLHKSSFVIVHWYGGIAYSRTQTLVQCTIFTANSWPFLDL